MRGLEPTGPVDRRTIDEAELKKQMEQLYREETPVSYTHLTLPTILRV